MSETESKTSGVNLRIVLYEGPGSIPLSESVRIATLSSLLNNGFEVTRPALGAQLAPVDGAIMLVLGQFETEKFPKAAGLSSDADLCFRDITNLSHEDVVLTVQQVRDEVGARKLEAWKPWFPVIDYDRCTNCMQCLSFCLFDVYAVDENKQIIVQNESNCKTDCPACSRVCPEVAILFPKYKKGPINGDWIREEDIQREAMKVDISALLGGDIYTSLRSRNKEARKRFSTERDESRALMERKKCLKKLKKDLDIPDEVLMSLPSTGDIQERAERVKAKLKKRQERSQTMVDWRHHAHSEDNWGI